MHPVDLSGHVLQALAARTGIDPAVVDDVVWGCVTQTGEQGFNIGRNAVLAAGWPESVPGTSVDRQCGSSQQALHFVAAGGDVGPVRYRRCRWCRGDEPRADGRHRRPGNAVRTQVMERYNVVFNQGIGAEMIAERWGFTRRQIDEFSLASAREGRRGDRRRSLPRPDRAGAGHRDDGTQRTFDTDEGVRRGGTVEGLGALKTPFKPDGVVTAGNSSQISDGAAALLVTTSEKAAELGLRPLVRLHTGVLAADDPVIMLTAPMPATRKALQRSGLSLDEIGAFEVNEAFATVPMAWLADIGAEEKTLNPNGGAVALGHPLGGVARRSDSPRAPHARQRHPVRAADHVRGRRDGQCDHPRPDLILGRLPLRPHRASRPRHPALPRPAPRAHRAYRASRPRHPPRPRAPLPRVPPLPAFRARDTPAVITARSGAYDLPGPPGPPGPP